MKQKTTLSQLTRDYLKELADFHPMSATNWGLSGKEAEFGDRSPARIRRHLAFLKSAESRLRNLPGSVNSVERIESSLLESEIALRKKEWGEWKKFQIDPTQYVGELVYGLWYLHLRVESREKRIEASLRRLEESSCVLEMAKANLGEPPRLWTRLAVQEAKGYLAFLEEIRRELLRLAPRRSAEIEAAVSKARKVAREFLQFLSGPLLKRSRGNFAAGSEEFHFRLKHYHHEDREAGDLKRLGEEEFGKVREELVAFARRIDPRRTWDQLVEKAKTRHPSASSLLSVYRRETARLRRYVRERRLVSLPRGEKLQVIPTPVFTRHTIPYAAYVDPPMFGKKNHGTFFVTPVAAASAAARREQLQEHNRYALRVTALHEGYPGHHLQFAVQKGAPGTMMRIFNCSSFYEGWALYCEELMAEQGFYDGFGRLIQLKDKLWRACRILVDVGLHTGGMSDAEAVRFMARELKMSPASARADVNWYTMSPTVPQSYYTGMLRLRALRERCRREWGARFTLQRFHDSVLQYGAIPIPLLEKALLSPLLAKEERKR
jgi:hypothetical protein